METFSAEQVHSEYNVYQAEQVHSQYNIYSVEQVHSEYHVYSEQLYSPYSPSLPFPLSLSLFPPLLVSCVSYIVRVRVCVCVCMCVCETHFYQQGVHQYFKRSKLSKSKRKSTTDQTVSLPAAVRSATRVCTLRVHIGESSYSSVAPMNSSLLSVCFC